MALYDYKCPKCQDIIAISHPMDTAPIILCAVCSSERNKVFSAPGLEFKGGGWGSSSN